MTAPLRIAMFVGVLLLASPVSARDADILHVFRLRGVVHGTAFEGEGIMRRWPASSWSLDATFGNGAGQLALAGTWSPADDGGLWLHSAYGDVAVVLEPEPGVLNRAAILVHRGTWRMRSTTGDFSLTEIREVP